MLLEPLTEIFKSKAEQVNQRLCEIRDNLGSIVRNTEAQLAAGSRQFRSIFCDPAKGAAESEWGVTQYRNNDAYGWVVKDIATTHICEVYLNSHDLSGFLGEFEAFSRENVSWYVPPGSMLIVVHKNVGENIAVNINIESLVTSAREASTGTGGESYDVERTPDVPSGHPVPLP